MNSIAMMGHGKYNQACLRHFKVNLIFLSIYTLCSITLDYACDAKPDCLDKSDEIGCDQIEFEKSYDKSVPRNSEGNKNISF